MLLSGETDTGATVAFQETSFRASQRTASTAVAGLIGGVIGFALSETYGNLVDTWGTFESQAVDIIVSVGIWFALALLGIGGALAAADSVINKDWQKAGFRVLRAAPLLIIGGIAAGFIAQIVYQNIVDFETVGRELDLCFEAGDRICSAALAAQTPGRAIGWGVAGMLGGIPIGLAASSRTLTQNGAIGGLIGGLIGGAAFDPIGLLISGPEGLSRLVGFLLIGGLIGAAYSAITAARTSVFLEVLTGDYAGTQFPLTDSSMLVGCAANAAITLRGDRDVKEHHFTLAWDGQRLSYECVRNSPAIDVDGTSATSGEIPMGSIITVGRTRLKAVGARSAAAPRAGSSTAGGTTPFPPTPPSRPNVDTRRDQPAPSPLKPPTAGPKSTPPTRPSIPVKKPNDPGR